MKAVSAANTKKNCDVNKTSEKFENPRPLNRDQFRITIIQESNPVAQERFSRLYKNPLVIPH